MGISTDLFKAILAMDSYNRGYDGGLDFGAGSDDTGVGIGTATISTSNSDPEAVTASFYAIAYNWDGGTVISYRGTDDLVADGPGISTGLGIYDNDQARLAAEFYRSVNGESTASNSNITLTGHSLGGGLAGFVGSIYGVDAVMFDNMAFEEAADNLGAAAQAYEHFDGAGEDCGAVMRH